MPLWRKPQKHLLAKVVEQLKPAKYSGVGWDRVASAMNRHVSVEQCAARYTGKQCRKKLETLATSNVTRADRKLSLAVLRAVHLHECCSVTPEARKELAKASGLSKWMGRSLSDEADEAKNEEAVQEQESEQEDEVRERKRRRDEDLDRRQQLRAAKRRRHIERVRADAEREEAQHPRQLQVQERPAVMQAVSRFCSQLATETRQQEHEIARLRREMTLMREDAARAAADQSSQISSLRQIILCVALLPRR